MNKLLSLMLVIATMVKLVIAQEVNNSTDVVVEEYVPKVIIESKWGTAPGEFGKYYDPNAVESLRIAEAPESIAMNSKGEIYILDHLNNRIQKFDKEGKYLLSIPVESCTDKNGKSAIEVTYSESYEGPVFYCKNKIFTCGINIVIDSQDNLYYYCIKGNKGEVWQFKNDKLVKKCDAPKLGGVFANPQDELWVGNFDFLAKKGIKSNRKNIFKKVIIKSQNEADIFISSKDSKSEKVLKIKSNRKLKEDERLWVILDRADDFKINEKGEIFIRYMQGIGSTMEVFINKYNSDGELISIAEGRIGNLDKNGNGYTLDIDDDGIKIVKWERKPKR